MSCGCDKRLSIKDIEDRLKKRGLELLSDRYETSNDKIKVKCYCGKIFEMRIHSIQKSCGCASRKTDKEIDKIFKKYRLERLSEYKGNKKKFKVKCFCGKTFYAFPDYIFSGDTTSCGCKSKIKGNKHFLWKGCGDISGQKWYKWKFEAKKRGIPFRVSIKTAWVKYVEQNGKCNLSGVDIEFSDKTASLDRIDSSKGYTKDNIQWVHKDINLMKWVFSQNVFIDLCHLVSSPIKNKKICGSCFEINTRPSFKGMGCISLSYWSRVKSREKIKNREVGVDLKYIWDLFIGQRGYCVYTGTPLSRKNLSLDRVDSNKGYVKGNVQWVCKEINFMKRNIEEKYWIKMCKNVSDHQKEERKAGR